MKSHLIIVFICAAAQFSFAQAQSIQFTNPSFEDFARAGRAPINWYDCGFPNETPPDVQPDPTFGITLSAYDGETYLGMVVRDNDTWESVSQKLSQPMQKGMCYELQVHLAKSKTYMSKSRVSNKEANYAMPAKLRVWGGFGHCDKQVLLAQTKLITNTKWEAYTLQFEAEEEYSHITFEAYYDESTTSPYNGNVLMDNLLKLIRCDY